MISTEKLNTFLEAEFNENLALIFCGYADLVLEKLEKDTLLKTAFKNHHVKISNSCNYDFDRAYVYSLTKTELSNLIKFYTIFETRFYFRGSVSAIPYLIKLLGERDYENYEALVNWTIETASSKNPYIPFGAIKYSECKSLKEYEVMLVAADEKLKKGEEDAAYRHSIKLEQQKIKDAKNIWGAIRRKDMAAIRIMIDRGLDLNAVNEEGVSAKQALAQQEIRL